MAEVKFTDWERSRFLHFGTCIFVSERTLNTNRRDLAYAGGAQCVTIIVAI